jgi:hypothetical protein
MPGKERGHSSNAGTRTGRAGERVPTAYGKPFLSLNAGEVRDPPRDR